jgi:asparagine synthase (glutamine-hydrolysing)
MQDFFGFIDYTKEDFSSSNYFKTTDTTLFYKKFSGYKFFLSYSKIESSPLLEDDEILLFLNGNIINQSILSLDLENTHREASTLLLLKKAYKRYGVKFIEKLEGNFALIIYDKKLEKLILIKDKVGVVPLNFYHSETLIIFGTRVSEFQKAPQFHPSVNPRSLASYLQFGCVLHPNTILDKCYKIQSGAYNYFDLVKKEYFSHTYWKLEECYQHKKIDSSEKEIIDNAHLLLQNSISKTYLNNAKVGLSLSGGYDSSSIAALLQEQSQHKLKTFTIGFHNQDINEAKDAKAIAKHLGTEHQEHYFTAKDALKIIPQLCKIYDEPFAEYAATPTVLTAELLKEAQIEHIFVGDGGDEVFATADDTHFFERIHAIPYELRALLTYPLKKLLLEKVPYLKDFHNLPTKYSKLLQILSSKNIPTTIEARNILFRENELQQLVQNYSIPITTTFNEINFNGYHETVDEIIGTYFKTTMTDGELVKSYGAMNQYDIRLHTPFLDEELIAYMAKVPSSIKIKEGIKKYILKEIAHQYIPKHLLDRPKSGFDIPFELWMRKELKELVYAQINEKRLNKDKLFYTSSVIKIRDSFYQGNDNFKYKLWRIFIFQLWYENFKG